MKKKKKKADFPKRPQKNAPVEFGKDNSEKNTKTRRRKMSYSVRDVTVSISEDNIKAHFEELLRRYKYLADDEDLVELNLSDIVQGFKADGKTKTSVLPLHYKSKREEVEVVKHW